MILAKEVYSVRKWTCVGTKYYTKVLEWYVYYLIYIRDLRYISIWQYIDAVIEYRVVIQWSMNIEVSKLLCSAE